MSDTDRRVESVVTVAVSRVTHSFLLLIDYCGARIIFDYCGTRTIFDYCARIVFRDCSRTVFDECAGTFFDDCAMIIFGNSTLHGSSLCKDHH